MGDDYDEAERAWQAAIKGQMAAANPSDIDDEAERAWQAAVNLSGAGGGNAADNDISDDEAERAWQAAQKLMCSNGTNANSYDENSSGSSGHTGRLTSLASISTSDSLVPSNFPSHWEGFITDIEKVWDISYSDLKFGERIGVGAFGSVCKGLYFGTEVAIKTVFTEGDETNLMYLMREINILKGCRHPTVVQFIGICRDNTNALLHIVTEYMIDGDLRGKLKNPKLKIPWDVRARICRDLASGMAYLHSRDILHRDLKCKNILVDSRWHIKLCDFGFARTFERVPRPMTLCGTEAWMAPEIIVGKEYGFPTDVFSYGIVLCEIISRGKVSHSFIRSAEDGFAFDKEKFLDSCPPDCHDDFKSAVTEATAFDPEKRPTFHELYEHFDLLAKDLEKESQEGAARVEASSALAKFRKQAQALTAPLIEKGTMRERRDNGLQRKVMTEEEKEPPKVIKAVPLKEQKSTRRVQVNNNRVSAVHNLIGGKIMTSLGGKKVTAASQVGPPRNIGKPAGGPKMPAGPGPVSIPNRPTGRGIGQSGVSPAVSNTRPGAGRGAGVSNAVKTAAAGITSKMAPKNAPMSSSRGPLPVPPANKK